MDFLRFCVPFYIKAMEKRNLIKKILRRPEEALRETQTAKASSKGKSMHNGRGFQWKLRAECWLRAGDQVFS